MLISDRYLYLKVRRAMGLDSISKWQFNCFSEEQTILIEHYYTKNNVQTLIPVYLFSGICLVMFLFTLAFFVNSRKLEFLYYGLYVLGLFLYLIPDIFKLHDIFFGGYSLISFTFFHSTQV